VLDTHDFGCWEAAVANALGHHSSELLTRSESFGTPIGSGQLGDCTLVHIQGRCRSGSIAGFNLSGGSDSPAAAGGAR